MDIDTTSWEKQININRSSVKPLYLQLKEALEAWVSNGLHDGSLSSGDRMPSENELSEKLRISPITVKRALDDLRRQGLIQRIQGRGSFIAERKKLIFPIKKLFSLTDYTREQGKAANRQTLELTEMTANSRLASCLNITEKALVARLVRIRLMDNLPIALETTYLPMYLFPNFLNEYSEYIPLYELLVKLYNQEVVRAEDIFEPILINPFEAKVLEIPVGSLGILVERTSYSPKEQPLEFTKSIFRGDLCSFFINILKGEQ
jgi:GntR family transcriptional regulator